jgi:hypothetical protein
VHPWSENLASNSSSTAQQQQQQQQQCVPLVLEVCVMGAAYPSSAADWLQLQGLKGVSTLLLPHHRPPLLPAMIENGIAGACFLITNNNNKTKTGQNRRCLFCFLECSFTLAVQQTGCSCRA